MYNDDEQLALRLIEQMQMSELNEKDLDGKTALEVAIEKKMPRLIGILIEKGVDITFLDRKQIEYILFQTAWTDQITEAAKIRLLRYGVVWCDFDVNAFQALSLFHLAIVHGHVQLAEEFIYQGADLNRLCVYSSFLATFHLIVEKEFASFRSLFWLLIKENAKLNEINCGVTELFEQVMRQGSENSMKFALCLIAAGADISRLHYAEATDLFIFAIVSNPADLGYSIQNQGQILHKLLRQGININPITFDGNSLLHLIIKNHFYDLAVEFVDLGANIDSLNREQATQLLFRAIRKRFMRAVLDLIEHGVDIHYREHSIHRSTLLHNAVRYLPQIINLLIEKGAQLNAVDVFDKTALHYAIDKGLINIVRQLLQNKTSQCNEQTVTAAAFKCAETACIALSSSIEASRVLLFRWFYHKLEMFK